ncbi:MAG: hypothetical protein H7Z14_03480, partial [Anaerolineae bacterium]|nr:hypothetical protein [Phycisphaerae bacterium]
SFAAMAILERGGKQVPISNLAEATANLMTFCLALQVHGAEQGHIVGFQSHPNQWAVFGSILGTSEAATVINLHPGEGAQLFVAAGDEQAEDIDLFLTDEEGTYVLASDTGGDSTPLMPQWTSSNRGYGIRAKMIRSTGDRPVMVLTAMLTVQ